MSWVKSMVREVDQSPIYWSQTRKATGGLERIPYDPLLYGDYLAGELDKDATLFKPSKVTKQGPQFPLGAAGHFGEVIQSMPLEMMIETKVYGPAHSKAVRHECDIYYNESTSMNSEIVNGDNAEMYPSHALSNGKDEYISRDIEAHLVRDDIKFMPILEANIRVPDPIESQVRQPKTIIGKILDESEILDDGHLPVQEQLSGRLVRVDRQGIMIKQEPAIRPIPFLTKNKRDYRKDELDPKLNSHLKTALEHYAYLYHEKMHRKRIINKKKQTVASSEDSAWTGYKRRHAVILTALPQKIKKKVRAIMKHRVDLKGTEILDDDHPNMRLRESIDHLHIHTLKAALKEGANVNFLSKGRSPIQSVFSRLCKIDSGDELNWNMSGYEQVADILDGWGCNMNDLDCEMLWNGWAPIHYATHYGNCKRLEWLVNCGASVHTKTSEGLTPLMLASEKGFFRHAYLLVKSGADFREKDLLGRTVLHYATAGGNIDLVKFLAECGCVFDKLKVCKYGESPLSISAQVNSACFYYLRKLAVPKKESRPFIDSLLSSQGSKVKNGAEFLKRGIVIRRKKKSGRQAGLETNLEQYQVSR